MIHAAIDHIVQELAIHMISSSSEKKSRRSTCGPASITGAHSVFEHMTGLYQRGEFDACIVAALRFTKTWQKVAPGWQMLAACLQAKGDFKNAEAAARQALSIDDNSADTHNIYGCLLKALGHSENAGYHFGRAIELKPHHAEAHCNLGALLIDLARLEEAESMLREAIRLKPDFALAHYQLGAVMRDKDRPDEAKLSFETALRHDPALTAAHIGLGHLMTHLGMFSEAEKLYRAAIVPEPGNGAMHYHLAFVKKFCAGDPDLAATESGLAVDGLTAANEMYLHYAAGKAHDDIGASYDVAFDHFDRASKLHRSQLKFDMSKIESDFSRVAEFFTASFLESRRSHGHRSAQPIFIVGMPRSGTTLVEQILASHPTVHATGERDDLARVAKSAEATMKGSFPDWVSNLDAEQSAKLGRKYMAQISNGMPDGAHVTDKMLTNFKLLGFIALILPDAKVVHVRRHPLDSCLSCYCQPFTSGSRFSYDLAELGRYYQAYHRLMEHWQQVLPESFLMTIDYEAVVEAPEDSARALISHCGLDWDDNCLNFQNTERQVKTASAAQVRKKLYSSSIGRWKNYEQRLGPLVDALGSLGQGHIKDLPRHHSSGQPTG